MFLFFAASAPSCHDATPSCHDFSSATLPSHRATILQKPDFKLTLTTANLPLQHSYPLTLMIFICVCKDDDHGNINFITEVCTSGNLRNYRKKRRHVLIKAFKKWSKQVLEGLDYLHAHDHQGI
ncbi:tyrosine kinase family protein [Medicago truncatula]|uniref:non-specific serine/threonine protein kinase n=1 Tax=Medicago truncatula TaxID=3880 RepID=A0A072TTQ4_MEDTR|nr:tyrosine kinase family protein [Medicago truncatula]